MLKNFVKITIVLLSFWVVCGFDIPDYQWYVTDTVGIFSDQQKADLTAKIEEIEKTTSIEIAVLVVPTVDDDINLAAVDVGNKWWVGKESQDNGLVILIAINDRKWSIQVGYGLEWTLPDLITKRIGDARFPPNFREGDYYQGVVEMLDDALLYIKQDPTIVQNYSQDVPSSSNSNFGDDMVGILFFVLIAITGFFSRWVTVPKAKGIGRKMKKHGRWMVAGTWLILSLVVTWVIWSFLIALFFSYIFLLFNIVMALFWRTWSGGGWIYHWWGSWGWWGSSFGGFSGWSFGGGWSSWSR